MRSLSLFTGILIFFCCFLPAERSLAGIRLAIAPFQVEQSQEKEVVRCRSCGNLFSGGSIEGDPANGLTRLLWEKFQNKGQEFELISPGQVEGAFNVFLAKGIEKNPLDLMTALGKQLEAEYILWGVVFQYQERKGSSIAVQRPASVAVDLHLLRVKEGRLIWRAQWAQTQQSLTENLLDVGSFFKRKMRWVTVEELSSQGIEKMLKEFPSTETLK
jgi:hypothetical protein